MPRLSPAQASAVRYLLGLPAPLPTNSTIGSLTRAGIVVVGADNCRRRVHPEHRAELCGPAGLTDTERATVDATLELWRRWDREDLAADEEASLCRQLVDGLPGHLRHHASTGYQRPDLARLAAGATQAADSHARTAADCRAEAARLTRRAESHEADAAALRDLAAAALATPRPAVTQ